METNVKPGVMKNIDVVENEMDVAKCILVNNDEQMAKNDGTQRPR